MPSPEFLRTALGDATAEAARVRFIRYCQSQGWETWGLWLAMGYQDDWLATLSDDLGQYLEDPPPLPMPTVAELRRAALHLGVSLEGLLTAAWGMSAASLADDDARVFEPRPPRRFGNVQPGHWGFARAAWPSVGQTPPDDETVWEASLEWNSTGQGDLVHRVCTRIGEAIVALGVAPACAIDDPKWSSPPLRVRAASRDDTRSVTIGLDGDIVALSRMDTRLEEIATWAFGGSVEVERGAAGGQPGLAFRLSVSEPSAGWSLLRRVDTEPQNRRRLPTPWPRRLALAPLATHQAGGLLFVNWQWFPALRMDLETNPSAPDTLTSLLASVLTGHSPRQTEMVLLGSKQSVPSALQTLPGLARFIVSPSDARVTRSRLGRIGAIAGERLARPNSDLSGIVFVFELTELDLEALTATARLARLGPSAGVQVVVASTRQWLSVVDHCPLGLLAACDSRLVPRWHGDSSGWLSAEIDDWEFGDVSPLPVSGRMLAELDRAYQPRRASGTKA
jgi:hypothetical protein